jgi:hypothetical protein
MRRGRCANIPTPRVRSLSCAWLHDGAGAQRSASCQQTVWLFSHYRNCFCAPYGISRNKKDEDSSCFLVFFARRFLLSQRSEMPRDRTPVALGSPAGGSVHPAAEPLHSPANRHRIPHDIVRACRRRERGCPNNGVRPRAGNGRAGCDRARPTPSCASRSRRWRPPRAQSSPRRRRARSSLWGRKDGEDRLGIRTSSGASAIGQAQRRHLLRHACLGSASRTRLHEEDRRRVSFIAGCFRSNIGCRRASRRSPPSPSRRPWRTRALRRSANARAAVQMRRCKPFHNWEARACR